MGGAHAGSHAPGGRDAGPAGGAISGADDLPVHQAAEPVRFAATSDRNFYDRYYFNAFPHSGEVMLIMGMGVYPNLGTQDAFAVALHDNTHRVVRSSRELGDRLDTSVGPLRIEILEPLRRCRFICDANDWGLGFDLTWTAASPPYQEPRHFVRKHGRVLFDTARFAQTGVWDGQLHTGDHTFTATADTWSGTRDRSWGVRPVGEAEPAGIHEAAPPFNFWNYVPLRFDEFSLLVMIQEDGDGNRELSEAVRIWHDPDRGVDQLGEPIARHRLRSGTRMLEHAELAFPHAPGGPLTLSITPLVDLHVMVGTGYGLEPHWRHGMYQGPLAVEGEVLDLASDPSRLFGLVDSAAAVTLSHPDGTTHEGHGLHEYGYFGEHTPSGLVGWDPAP